LTLTRSRSRLYASEAAARQPLTPLMSGGHGIIKESMILQDSMTEAKASDAAQGAKKKAYLNIILPLFLVSVVAYLDRVNIGYAALTMNEDLGLTAQMFGLGAGIFFAGYILFEIPGALIAEKYSPKIWLARIMITWGLVSGLMAFMTTAWQFYVIRFLLGAAEASLYPVIYASFVPRWFSARDRVGVLALLLTSLQISGIIGAPLAGWLIGVFIQDPRIGFCFVVLAAIGVYAPFGVWWSYPTTFLSGTSARLPGPSA